MAVLIVVSMSHHLSLKFFYHKNRACAVCVVFIFVQYNRPWRRSLIRGQGALVPLAGLGSAQGLAFDLGPDLNRAAAV